ncbi:MAG: PH domain-containing protein [Candidatus ainarchaeum sp.]|nr:PH domain-containing protein [Candidatus ainarchaeum sp.]
MADPLDESAIRRLDPKVRVIWGWGVALLALIVWFLLSFLLGPALFPDGLLGFAPGLYAIPFFIILLLLLALYAVWVELKYRNYVYYMTDEEIVISRGIFGKERTSIALEKVQDVHVLRTLPEKLLGLATLKIEAAEMDQGVLPGISDYKTLIDEILKRMEHARGRTEPDEAGMGQTARPQEQDKK